MLVTCRIDLVTQEESSFSTGVLAGRRFLRSVCAELPSLEDYLRYPTGPRASLSCGYAPCYKRLDEKHGPLDEALRLHGFYKRRGLADLITGA